MGSQKKEPFALGAVLAVLHARPELSRLPETLAKLVEFLVGSVLSPGSRELEQEVKRISPQFGKQFPKLKAATVPPWSFASSEALWSWLVGMEREHGITVEVKPIRY